MIDEITLALKQKSGEEPALGDNEEMRHVPEEIAEGTCPRA